MGGGPRRFWETLELDRGTKKKKGVERGTQTGNEKEQICEWTMTFL